MENEIKELVDRLNAAPPRPIPEDMSDNDRMMGKAYQWASGFLVGESDRQLLPTWAILTESGQLVIMATPFDGDTDKDMIAAAMRKFMREAKVTRYTFATEGWMAKVSKDDWDHDKRLPSERDERMEVVIITAADKASASVKIYEIVREWETGKVTDLKPVDPERTMDGFEGRFFNLLADEH